MKINQTRIKKIPVNWEIVSLEKLSTIPITNGLYKSKENYGNGPFMVHMTEVFAYDVITHQEMPRVQLTEAEKSKYLLEPGDLLFARRSLKPEGAGDVTIVWPDTETSFESSIIRLRLIASKALPKFVFFYLKSKLGKNQMMSIVRRVAVSGITGTDLKKIQIPPIDEQSKIIKILETWDKAIENTERLISAKEKQFEWLLANLINKSNYPKKGLKGVLTEISIRNNNKYTRVLSITNNRGFVLPEERFERCIASFDLSNYKVVRKGEYAYNPSRINVGSIARLDNWEDGVLSPMYTVFQLDKDQINAEYFSHWLFSKQTRQCIKNKAQGSVRETVSFGDLCSIMIPFPNLNLQQKIALKLNTARNEIQLLCGLSEYFSSQKLGLMHKLLTGALRLREGVNCE